MFHRLPIFSHPPKQAHRRGPLRIASAERRVKPPARLLRRATAPQVTTPLGCGSDGWYGRKVSFRRSPQDMNDNILYHALVTRPCTPRLLSKTRLAAGAPLQRRLAGFLQLLVQRASFFL